MKKKDLRGKMCIGGKVCVAGEDRREGENEGVKTIS